jgi:hypothetical protein
MARKRFSREALGAGNEDLAFAVDPGTLTDDPEVRQARRSVQQQAFEEADNTADVRVARRLGRGLQLPMAARAFMARGSSPITAMAEAGLPLTPLQERLAESGALRRNELAQAALQQRFGVERESEAREREALANLRGTRATARSAVDVSKEGRLGNEALARSAVDSVLAQFGPEAQAYQQAGLESNEKIASSNLRGTALGTVAAALGANPDMPLTPLLTALQELMPEVTPPAGLPQDTQYPEGGAQTGPTRTEDTFPASSDKSPAVIYDIQAALDKADSLETAISLIPEDLSFTDKKTMLDFLHRKYGKRKVMEHLERNPLTRAGAKERDRERERVGLLTSQDPQGAIEFVWNALTTPASPSRRIKQIERRAGSLATKSLRQRLEEAIDQ